MNGDHQRRRRSRSLKRTANKRLRELDGDVAGYKGRCLFVTDDNGGYCDKPVSNNCHVVSESAVLHELRDDKTERVRELGWGVSQWRELLFKNDVEQLVQDTTTFDPSWTTTHDACASRFACNPPHDTEFHPTDVAEPDFCDPVVRFLAGYRIALFLADLRRLALELQQKWDQDVMRIAKPRDRALWRGENEKLTKGFRRAESTVKLLGRNWHARKTGGTFDLDVVSAQVLTFRSKLRLAGGVSYGKATGVTVFPVQGDLHKMGVLYLTSESDPAEDDLERLTEVARGSEESANYGVTVTTELMTNGWGVLAVSPKSYEGLNDGDRSTIQCLVAKHSRVSELVKITYGKSSRSKSRRK